MRANNHYSNLRWAIAKENGADRRRHKSMLGENNGRAKLTCANVKKIRRLYTGQYGQVAELARSYGVAETTMWSVINGQNWKHI